LKKICEPVDTKDLCSYGCGRIAQYRNGSNNLMCETSSAKCPQLRKLNSDNLKLAYKTGKRNARLDYSKRTQESKDKFSWNRNIFNAEFALNGKGSHKKVLLNERGHKCESCKNDTWLGEPIPLELEHCDGNNKNNEKSNLLLLCPNCHAKTEFYRGRNINNHGKMKVSDDEIIKFINEGNNIRQTLIKVGLTPKGANYSRVKKLIERIN